ncbi:MAG: hypothetical protein Q9196_001329 [Gyalolechia fulgens]
MDFWHCHKPDTDDALSHHQNGLRKGYGAASTIEATAGVGLVDVMYLLLSHEDVNVVTSQKATKLKRLLWQKERNLVSLPKSISDMATDTIAKYQHLSCAVGTTVDVDCGQIRLYKWEIRLAPTSSSAWQESPAEKFVSAQITALIGSQGVQRLVIHDRSLEEDNGSLLVWVFNTNIVYSSTLVPESPRPAMKVYYKTILDPTKVLEREGFKAEELQLPGSALRSLHSALHASNCLLPASIQRFQDWSVGLLTR